MENQPHLEDQQPDTRPHADPVPHDSPVSAAPRPPGSRRRVWGLLLAALALVLLGGMAARYYLGGDRGNYSDEIRQGDPPLAADTPADTPAEAAPPAEPQHPLDPVLEIARDGLERIHGGVDDYTATIVKRERINGQLIEQTMFAKVRNRKEVDGTVVQPFSVYLKFLEPASVRGREVIWVEGANNDKLIAHDGGFKNLLRVHLDTEGFLAMMGNRYPITEIGIENLVVRLIERGEQDKALGPCEVTILEGEELNERPCRVIQVMHPEPDPKFDFHLAQIFIDQELQMPLRYGAYLWPSEPGGEPVLDEQYTYKDLQLNVGLTDQDFDPDNPNYDYP